MTRRNLEIKARCTDLELALRRALDAGAVEQDPLDQIDTYFHVPHGRLKLRQIAGQPAQLIAYQRPDQSGPRGSEFELTEIADPGALMQMLTSTLGIRAEVRKHRRLLLWKNVRIHLDQVQDLGGFIELEAVVACDEDQSESPSRLALLCGRLEIAADQMIGASYCELLISSHRGIR